MQTYNHETVVLDDGYFDDCEFQDCRLVYSGGGAPIFSNCRFVNCEWKLEDAAARTLEHLKTIWAQGGKAPVQAMIKDITGATR